MKRSKHSLSHYKLTTGDMGELIPIACVPVLPGDTVQHATSLLLRVSPLLFPVMHPVSVRVHHFFVPNRLLWDGWEDFITGGADGEGGDAGAFPTITINNGTGFAVGSLADHLGIPPLVDDLEVSALPFRAYALIYNELYRDQDLVSKVGFSTASGADSTTNQTLQKVAWEKDYFTAARPWPQKGPEVTLPLGNSAPVIYSHENTTPWQTRKPSDGTLYTAAAADSVLTNNAGNLHTNAGGTPTLHFDPNGNLIADLSSATSVPVTDLLEAFALQRMMDARAMFGSRYSEYLRFLGVRSSDARLQRPEYLGGGKQVISFSEVLQTAPTTPTSQLGVADLLGHGIAAMRSRRYRRFFEEHGFVMSLLSVRPRAMYANSLPREFSRRTKEDFWQKELERIGQQEIYRREIYAQPDGSGGNTVFGYGDRYDEYRHHPSTVAGEFRTSTLNFAHLARILGAPPTLNSDFITCDPSKRIHAVQTEDVLWIMANHSIQARRLVGRNVLPRLF